MEDDTASRRALSRILRASGLRVVSFSSAEELLQAWEETQPSCLVVDVMLPGLSGPDLLERMQATSACPPAVFVTGRIDGPAMLRKRGFGHVPCLQKPFEPALLVAAVTRALEAAASTHA